MSAVERVVIYTRISLDPSGEGAGTRRQLLACRKYAREHDLLVVREIEDLNESAYSGKERPGFEAVLQMVKNHEVDAVVVWSTDRLYRRVSELERTIDILERHRTNIYAVHAGRADLSTSQGRMVARLGATFAQHEMEVKGERTSAKFRELAEQGRWKGGRRPWCFERDGITVRESEAAVFREAAERVLNGYTMSSVAEWASEQIQFDDDHQAKRIDPRSLRDALVGHRMIGKRTYRSNKAVERRKEGTSKHDVPFEITTDAEWPAILDAETWQALRTKLVDGKQRRASRPRKGMLTSVLFCGECGHGLGLGGTKNYVCPSKAHGGCASVSIARRSTETLVLDVIEEALNLDHDLLAAGQRDVTSVAGPAATEVNKRLEDIERRRREVVEIRDLDGITHQEAMRRLGTLKQEAHDVARASNDAVSLQRARVLAGNAVGRLKDMPGPEQRTIAHVLFSHVIVLKATQMGRTFRGTDRLVFHWRDQDCDCEVIDRSGTGPKRVIQKR